MRPSIAEPAEDRARIPHVSCPVATVAAKIVSIDLPRLILVAEDERRAEEIAELAAAFAPMALVVHVAASDALPGDMAAPSAANVGRRVAALRTLRASTAASSSPLIILVVSAEASSVRYAGPDAFDEVPPTVRSGNAIDPAAFADRAAAIGYHADDQADEPGDIAVRGNVIDIFAADRASPVRIEFADGVITSLRTYDPLTQLSHDDIDEFTMGRANEPDLGAGVPITDHLPGAAIFLEPAAQERRAQFLSMAVDGTSRERIARQIVGAKEWSASIGKGATTLGDEMPEPPPRFVERKDPVRAFRRFATGVVSQGRLAIAGSARDLRFLAARIDPAPDAVASLEDAMIAAVGSTVLLEAPVERGFVHGGLTVVAAADLLGTRARIAEPSMDRREAFAGLAELHVGDVVVDEQNGIGAVAGIETVRSPDGDDADADAIVVEYAKGTRRLVPVVEADRIWRYGAEADAVTLDTLDGGSWIKRRASIDAAIAESARALQALAAERDARTTEPIVPATARYEQFAAGFAFSATPDQARAIAAVRQDLASGRPMDRLVVGDVGYGKTEVALRAAALVALAGRQVAVVAPTTVLVRQHLDTFRKRFSHTGREVAALSRLSSPAERRRVRAGLGNGSIAVVIGTAAVAAKGICYHDLALVVIDEEQRFGTAAKSSLRAMGAGHVLTLSATPIPRTLQSAMVGLQDISIIATPPARRQPIRTVVARFDDDTVRRALRRERGRGGQSFVVVPRIEDIEPLAATLARLVPDLVVTVAHGKMDAEALDDAMTRFAGGEGDILLATNIIEAGLDVPRANTMIVHHADRFGLSQLHQLRGRVGRAGRQGQILLLTEADATIADSTMKRLHTLQAFDQLGAGFAISARDLDVRGAGDLVGEEQAGHMKLIGVDLYQHLLAQALRAARGQEVDHGRPVLNLGVSGGLPEAWIPEVDVRLTLYSQLAHASDIAAIDAFQAELEDRFGALPDSAVRLLETARIGALAAASGVRQIDVGPGAIALTLDDPKTDLPAPFERSKRRWLVRERIDDPLARIERVRALLNEIGE